MKNKSITAKVAGLIILLVVCIGALVIWTNYTVTQNVVSCFVARRDIDPYTTITHTNFNEFFEETTIHKTSYEKLKTPVSSKDEIVGYETVSKIAQGYPIDKTLFRKNTANSYAGIDTPMKVRATFTTEDTLTKGKTVTLIGSMNTSGVVVGDNGETASDTWLGILTNNAIVFETERDKNGDITSAVFIVDQKVYSRVLFFSQNYKIFAVEGEVKNLVDVKSEVIKNLYLEAGMNVQLDFAITNTKESFDVARVKQNKPTFFATGEDDNYYSNTTQSLTVLKTGKDLTAPKITWTGTTTSAFIYHYKFDGSRGVNYGIYSRTAEEKNKRIVYDSSKNEFSFNEFPSEEGFYQIIFDVKNPDYGSDTLDADGTLIKEPYYLHYCLNFVIENNNTTFVTNPKITIDTLNNNNVYTGDLKNNKEYYEKIDLMKGYNENIKLDSDEIKLMYINVYNLESDEYYKLPYFQPVSSGQQILTPTEDQFETIQKLFGKKEGGETDFLSLDQVRGLFQDDLRTRYIYSKEQVQFIIDELKNITFKVKNLETNDLENKKLDNCSDDEKYLILYSLGFKGLPAGYEKEIINSIFLPNPIYKRDENGNVIKDEYGEDIVEGYKYTQLILKYNDETEGNPIDIHINANKSMNDGGNSNE